MRRRSVKYIVAHALAALTTSGAIATHARPRDAAIVVASDGEPIADVLRSLAARAGFQLHGEELLADRVTAHFATPSVDDALRRVLNGHSYLLRLGSDGTPLEVVVLSDAPHPVRVDGHPGDESARQRARPHAPEELSQPVVAPPARRKLDEVMLAPDFTAPDVGLRASAVLDRAIEQGTLPELVADPALAFAAAELDDDTLASLFAEDDAAVQESDEEPEPPAP